MPNHKRPHTPKDIQVQLEFARHVYDNQQAIIRQIDTKAGVFITLLVFLATGAFPLAKDVCAKLQWTGRGAFTSWAYMASGITLALGFVATGLSVQKVIRSRGSEYPDFPSGLMFWKDILAHDQPKNYHEATVGADEETLLANLTDQIFQLGAIAQRKTEALNFAQFPTMISISAWAMNSIVALYILTWR